MVELANKKLHPKGSHRESLHGNDAKMSISQACNCMIHWILCLNLLPVDYLTYALPALAMLLTSLNLFVIMCLHLM